jgi:pimeloyl-ACP methyl ester carboxylesterase
MQAIYLHGFASGPTTTSKGQRLAGLDVPGIDSFNLPSLEGASFFDLTWDGLVDRARSAVLAAEGPVLLMGSSLGGFLAAWLCAHDAAVRARVAACLLIAPAFGFATRWREILGEAGVAAWQRDGQRLFWHYGREREEALSVAFLESVRDIADLPPWSGVPTAIVHGEFDETVAWEWSWRWYQQRPYAGPAYGLGSGQAPETGARVDPHDIGLGLGYHLVPDNHSLEAPATQNLLAALYRSSAST